VGVQCLVSDDAAERGVAAGTKAWARFDTARLPLLPRWRPSPAPSAKSVMLVISRRSSVRVTPSTSALPRPCAWGGRGGAAALKAGSSPAQPHAAQYAELDRSTASEQEMQ
jgi:hypothetical protein